MSKSPQSSEEKLHELAEALDGLERKNPPAAAPVAPKPVPHLELGPKTKLAVRVMAWGFGLFWILWLALALIVTPPDQISLVAVPISAFIIWLIFQFHRMILIGVVRRTSGDR